MEEALRGILKHIAPVHWGMAPQGSLRPFIVLNVVSAARGRTSDGVLGPRETRVQADIYAETYGATKLLSRRLVAEMDGRRPLEFWAIFVASEQDLPRAGAGGSQTEFRTSIDLIIHH